MNEIFYYIFYYIDTRRGPEYFYWLFDVFPKQATCEMKTLSVQVYIQKSFQGEQGAKFL